VTSFELASYEPAHRDHYLGLLREAWGPGSMTAEEFDWWFDRNPAGSLRSVALAGGRVVGVAAHSLFRMALGGEERLASFSVHATTRASARGQGIFAALERKHEEEAAGRGVACVLAFASKPTAPIFLGPLGWTEIARLRVWARPLRGREAHEGRLERFTHEGDAAAGWPGHVIRDPTHLAWRYLDSPKGYVAVRGAGSGYGVVGRRPFRGGTAATLVDLAAPAGEVRALLRRAVRAASGRMLVALPAPEHRGAYASLGFLPAPYTLHFMGKALAGGLDTDPRAWRFTLGDTDFF
jgi:GNAT superfamily N-acetyltransferase